MNIIRPDSRRGFTLVELLVVVTVISVLMGLLLAGVNGAREAMRRMQCTHNQAEIAKILLANTNSANGTLPGLVSKKQGKEVSWVVSILVGLQQEAWYKEYLKTSLTDLTTLADNAPRIKGLICPSDSDKANDSYKDALSYVVNCGQYDDDGTAGATTAMHCGLFLDKRVNSKKVTLDSIKNGASNTIMLTENRQATYWLRTRTDMKDLSQNQFWFVEKVGGDSVVPELGSRVGGSIGDLGFQWAYGTQASFGAGGNRLRWINEYIMKDGKIDHDYDGQFSCARPSSNHPGIVIATFADGHVDTINDDVEESVYIKMCDGETEAAHSHSPKTEQSP